MAFALLAGLILIPGKISAQSDSIPFSRIELLDDYEPWMDTLKTPMESIELHIYAEQCLDVNGELVEYLDRADDEEITVGSVIDLNPGDSVNLYYWGSAAPLEGNQGGDVPVSLYMPVNSPSDTIEFATSGGEDEKEGVISFINGNVDYDLVVFRLSGPGHEYRLRFTYDSYVRSDTGTTTSVLRPGNFPGSGVKLYPNPVRDHAYFETARELQSFGIYDIHGKRKHFEKNPRANTRGCYSLDLGLLETGIWIIRFRYTDLTTDAVRILVE